MPHPVVIDQLKCLYQALQECRGERSLELCYNGNQQLVMLHIRRILIEPVLDYDDKNQNEL